ncbi:MAG: HAMP domain-containing protein [Methylomarinum sp.]|nr:HAMP domain-containing protein [Methylomarinum sp.]
MTSIHKINLSAKLVLLFLLTGIAIIIVFGISAGSGFKKHFQDSLNPHLYQYFNYINSEIGSPPDLKKAQQLSESLNIKILLKGTHINWSSDDSLSGFPEHLLTPNFDKANQYMSSMERGRFAIQIPNATHQATFITQHEREFPSPWKLLSNTLLGLFLVLGLLYLVLRWMISPLKQIQTGISRIGAGELDYRIKITRQDELGSLATEINKMADDIENMLAAKQQLLLAISHELRSPITRSKVALSLMEDSQMKDGLKGDIDEMEKLVTDLLEAERLNHRHQELHLSQVTFNKLIRRVIAQSFPNEPIEQMLATNIPTQSLDETRFQFVIKNLLGNALTYRKQTTDTIIISTKVSDQWVYIVVEDHGNGIHEKHIPHLTEPFYRVDPSRQRETGGYGLGLYIIKMIVEAHQGNLVIESTENIGTKIIIKLPY